MYNYYDLNYEGMVVEIDRSYADEIVVKLSCGYTQRFWADFTDEEAVAQTIKMKEQGIK